MRKTVALVVGWLLAGVGAVALASMAVGAVGDQLTGPDRPAALSASDVRAELDAAATTTTVAPASTSTTVPPGPDATVDDHGQDGVTDASERPTATTSATRPPPPTIPASTKTFTVVGGSVVLRFSPAGVTVVTATPNPGFRVDVEPEHGNGVRVEFESPDHRSRVSGWWDGTARSDTREDTSGGGGGGGGGPSGGDDGFHG